VRGYRHLDVRYRSGDPRRMPVRWQFCSRRCQDAFHQLYVTRQRKDPALIEELLPMSLPLSPPAQRTCLQALASAAEQVGFEVPIARYSQAQAVDLIETVIRAYEGGVQAPRPRGPDGFEDADIPFD
jgi:hypothetical protein